MTNRDGVQTQMNSFKMVEAPAELKNASPMGDETIGRHGKKNLVDQNGAKSATPSVPSTMASRNECDAVAQKKNATSPNLPIPSIGSLKNSSTTTPLKTNAKNNECVSPRCPSIVV
jgi:hypothetical protein